MITTLLIASLPYFQTCVDAGTYWGIDPLMLEAVMLTESGGRADAVSSMGAVGVMQFMPDTAAELGIDPLNPCEAIWGAAKYLAWLKCKRDDPFIYIAKYEMGPYSGVIVSTSYSRRVMRLYDKLRGLR